MMTEQVLAPDASALRDLARFTRLPGQRDEGRDRLIRFLDAWDGSARSEPIVDSLCAHFGLYPYMSLHREALSTSEMLAFEFHRPTVELHDPEFVFHSEQSQVFHRLRDGRNVILSAPTSFGKSAILDALVASQRWSNIVVIVPTVALIDETRRRLVRHSQNYTLVTHPSQEHGPKNIYVLTQERFLELEETPEVDLFMIDEFYKLSTKDGADDQRMSMLNIAWNELRSTGAQYYLTGPNVDALSEALEAPLRDSLVVSSYRTVAVDVEDRSDVPDDARLADMRDYWASLEDATLVFVSAVARAERMGVAISEFEHAAPPSEFATQVGIWLADNFHPDWRVTLALQEGVGVHTGPMPRSLQRVMIRLFGSGQISTLVCTSTLIEGVNTTAKNVVVWDKKINQTPIDYFTFSNVRGRAGRMSNHFVGRVITYMSPPDPTMMEVDIPIESQLDDAPLSSIVQLPDDKLTPTSRDRLQSVAAQADLSVEAIRKNRGFDPELQIEAARRLFADPAVRQDLAWSGFPTNAQARAVLNFGLSSLLTPRQRGGMTFYRLWGTLKAVRDSQGDLQALVAAQLPYKRANEDLSDVVATVLAFQRNWMGFRIPALLRATQTIYNEVARSVGERGANYEFYLSQIESVFMSSNLLDLDEYGLPLPLALRFAGFGMLSQGETADVLVSFANLAQRSEVRQQLSAVELWIVDDVLQGLGVTPTRSGPEGTTEVAP